MRSQFAVPQSYEKLKNGLQLSSKTTIQKYLGYLQESYLLFELQRYSAKYREQIRSPRKYMPVDLGLCIDQIGFRDSLARRLEAFVYLELRRRERGARNIFSYQTRAGYEVDYVVQGKSAFEELLQVCYSLNDPGTLQREARALAQASEEVRCSNLTILTWDGPLEEISERQAKIRIVPIHSWLNKAMD